MNTATAQRILYTWMATRRSRQKPPPLVRHAYAWTERKAQAKGPSVSCELYNFVCLARDEIMQRGAGYSKRAQVRIDVADYLERKIYPVLHDWQFLKMADKLRAARQTGTWGSRPNGDQVIIWDDKSGLLRLDPDEAREDAQRLSERYSPELLKRMKNGNGAHYAVFTLPNFAAGDLKKGMDAIYRRYANLLRKQLGKKKLFPEILGSIGVIETPLAADGTWNVHLNVILLTRSRFEAGLYKKLRRAWSWGSRPNGDQVIIWDDKSGLLRLDPDEAREDAQRLSERYSPELLKRMKNGNGAHYAVFTLPNFAAGDLKKGMDAIYRRYANLLRKQLGKKKLFPEILGSIGVIETPLAADGTWNVHLNVILLTRSRFEAGLYKKLRRAWYWNVHLNPIQADVGDLARTFRELIKYATRTVPEKSADKAGRKSRAPALIEWPAERFIEWHKAHQGFRRTRTYGKLYGKNVPKPEPSSLDDVTWHGAVHCAPDRFFAQVPLIDLIPGHNLATDTADNQATGPPPGLPAHKTFG